MAKNILIHDGDIIYRLRRVIGTWGPSENFTVREAIIGSGRPHIPATDHVAMKVIINNDDNVFDIILDDLNTLSLVVSVTDDRHPPPNVLTLNHHFFTQLNNIETLCMVLPFAEVSSIRSLISSQPRFSDGIPQNCIAFVLKGTLAGLSDIHFFDQLHGQITVGNIFFHHHQRKIKLAYAATIYNSTQIKDQAGYLPINAMPEWARAPEVVDDMNSESLYGNETDQSDIWLVGIAALELAFGKIQVRNRQELLGIAEYISREEDLPNTWEELRTKAAAKRMEENKIPEQDSPKTGAEIGAKSGEDDRTRPLEMDEKRFSGSFVKFVAYCLATNPNDRAESALDLGEHEFIRRNRADKKHFQDIMVKGLNLRVAQVLQDHRSKVTSKPKRVKNFSARVTRIKRLRLEEEESSKPAGDSTEIDKNAKEQEEKVGEEEVKWQVIDFMPSI